MSVRMDIAFAIRSIVLCCFVFLREIREEQSRVLAEEKKNQAALEKKAHCDPVLGEFPSW